MCESDIPFGVRLDGSLHHCKQPGRLVLDLAVDLPRLSVHAARHAPCMGWGTHIELDVLVARLEQEVEDLGKLGNGLNGLFDGPDMSSKDLV